MVDTGTAEAPAVGNETGDASVANTAPVGRTLAPALTFILVLAMAYGFEVFSFHLTLDEESFGETSSTEYAQIWLAQGRWAMAALTLLVPSPVVPVVSTFIGVTLTGLALWTLCRRYFHMGPWQTVLSGALAATIPTLAFMFSFSTIAYGIGIGNILLVIYFAGMSSSKWLNRGIGVVALVLAVGIYDSFLVAGAALAVALLFKRPQWSTAGFAVASLGLAYFVSKAVATVGQGIRGLSPDSYTNQFIDLVGLISDPAGRVRQALSSVRQVVTLSAERFGLHSPWLAIALGALIVLAAVSTFGVVGRRAKATRLSALAVLLLLPVGIEAVAPTPVLLRSMIYLPIIVVVLAGLAVKGAELFSARVKYSVLAFVGAAIILAIVGQATISNRLFAASEMTYAQDQNLAFLIGLEKERLTDRPKVESIPVVFAGTHSWSEASLVPARETLGISFFAGLGGTDNLQQRNAAFLRSQGVAVRAATELEAEGANASLDAMPSYPAPGWMAYEGGVLLINFGTPDVR
ncbi:glucosyltransferase domain-containing protein [Cryobacterium sp. Y11]|uniref:glucosyltransferase domain-containing protein n=1 Tax=Cryobacterium sp. Y11 TaxID=2045016 RepID=UPI000CE44B4E|nr:glucosyltransferase domain-containing protein [Cryobacterium sp. Y11]